MISVLFIGLGVIILVYTFKPEAETKPKYEKEVYNSKFNIYADLGKQLSKQPKGVSYQRV